MADSNPTELRIVATLTDEVSAKLDAIIANVDKFGANATAALNFQTGGGSSNIAQSDVALEKLTIVRTEIEATLLAINEIRSRPVVPEGGNAETAKLAATFEELRQSVLAGNAALQRFGFAIDKISALGKSFDDLKLHVALGSQELTKFGLSGEKLGESIAAATAVADADLVGTNEHVNKLASSVDVLSDKFRQEASEARAALLAAEQADRAKRLATDIQSPYFIQPQQGDLGSTIAAQTFGAKTALANLDAQMIITANEARTLASGVSTLPVAIEREAAAAAAKTAAAAAHAEAEFQALIVAEKEYNAIQNQKLISSIFGGSKGITPPGSSGGAGTPPVIPASAGGGEDGESFITGTTGQLVAFAAASAVAITALGALRAGYQSLIQEIEDDAKAAREFNAELTKLKVASDATPESLARLTEGILAVSNATGIAAGDVAKGAFEEFRRGVKGDEEVVQAITTSGNLAVATFGSMGDAVNLLTETLNAYGKKQDDAGRLANIYFDVVKGGKVSLDELSHGLGEIVQVASPLGVGIEEITGAVLTLTASGKPANETLTGLRTLLITLEREHVKLDDALKLIGKRFDENTLRTLGLAGTLDLLKEATHGNLQEFESLLGRQNSVAIALGITGDKANVYAANVEKARGATSDFSAQTQVLASDAKRVELALNAVANTKLEVIGQPALKAQADFLEGLLAIPKQLDITHDDMLALRDIATGVFQGVKDGALDFAKDLALLARAAVDVATAFGLIHPSVDGVRQDGQAIIPVLAGVSEGLVNVAENATGLSQLAYAIRTIQLAFKLAAEVQKEFIQEFEIIKGLVETGFLLIFEKALDEISVLFQTLAVGLDAIAQKTAGFGVVGATIAQGAHEAALGIHGIADAMDSAAQRVHQKATEIGKDVAKSVLPAPYVEGTPPSSELALPGPSGPPTTVPVKIEPRAVGIEDFSGGKFQREIQLLLRDFPKPTLDLEFDVPPASVEAARKKLEDLTKLPTFDVLDESKVPGARAAIAAIKEYEGALAKSADVRSRLLDSSTQTVDDRLAKQLTALEIERHTVLDDLRLKGANVITLDDTHAAFEDRRKELITQADHDRQSEKDKTITHFQELIDKALNAAQVIGDAKSRIGQEIGDLGKTFLSDSERAVLAVKDHVSTIVRQIDDLRLKAVEHGQSTADIDALKEKVQGTGADVVERARAQAAREDATKLADAMLRLHVASATALPDFLRDVALIGPEAEASTKRAEAAFAREAQALGKTGDAAKKFIAEQVAAQKLIDQDAGQQKLFGLASKSSINTAQDIQAAELFAKAKPFLDQYKAELDAIHKDSGLTDDQKVARDLANLEKLRGIVEKIRLETQHTSEAFNKGFSATLQDRIKQSTDSMAQGAALAGAGFDSLGNDFADATFKLESGSETGKEAVKDFVRNLVADLAKAIDRIIAFDFVASLAGIATSAATPSLGSANAGADIHTLAIGGVMPGQIVGSYPINAYAGGGVANTPQMAIFGEAGAEAFVPLPGPNRGIPVEFKDGAGRGGVAHVLNVTVNYQPVIRALDGNSAREILMREARTLGDIVANEVQSGANAGLAEVMRTGGDPTRGR